ncbi:cytochrome P450 93A2 [Cucurbita pepo subsp. pepo]|uniref:cytochrome P450 93A2 n=1 Tax=Cucurbita pepo subsp. pepo TaxID=3664 RepID=UPI000C9D68AC|nr:cytochrome P450 93A2 [Cucurbita pepo subsp. pepo]
MEDFQSYTILFLIWLLSTITIRFIFAKTKPNPRLPPTPLALPIIGHLHLLGPLPHKAFHKLSTRHGPLMHLRLGSVPCIVVSSAETAKQVLKTHESSFSNRPHLAAVDYLTYGSADFSFAPYGRYWKFMKKLCMSELLGSRTLDSLAPIRQDETRRFLRSLQTKAVEGKDVDVGRELMRASNNVISRMTLGKRSAEEEEEAEGIRMLVKDVAELTGTFNVADYIWFCKGLDLQGLGKRLREVRERFDEMMERLIMEHEESLKMMEMEGNGDEKVMDLLHILLLKFRDENSEVKLTRENIKAFILDIFAAGTDASAVTTEWALAELINHPNIMEKARQELHTVVGKSRLVEESDITNLPYLQAIVKETLRLHSSPLIVRESTESCTINGYEIPAKTQLYVNIWAIGRDPNQWERPLEFEPDRFMGKEGSVSGDLRGQNFNLLPFGSGRRSCPGTTLALLIVQTTLACLVQCFDWKVTGGDGKVDMEEGPGLTLPRAHPLICVPIACLSPFPSLADIVP